MFLGVTFSHLKYLIKMAREMPRVLLSRFRIGCNEINLIVLIYLFNKYSFEKNV